MAIITTLEGLYFYESVVHTGTLFYVRRARRPGHAYSLIHAFREQSLEGLHHHKTLVHYGTQLQMRRARGPDRAHSLIRTHSRRHVLIDAQYM